MNSCDLYLRDITTCRWAWDTMALEWSNGTINGDSSSYNFVIEHLAGNRNPAEGTSIRPDYEIRYERPTARLLATLQPLNPTMTTSYQDSPAYRHTGYRQRRVQRTRVRIGKSSQGPWPTKGGYNANMATEAASKAATMITDGLGLRSFSRGIGRARVLAHLKVWWVWPDTGMLTSWIYRCNRRWWRRGWLCTASGSSSERDTEQLQSTSESTPNQVLPIDMAPIKAVWD